MVAIFLSWASHYEYDKVPEMDIHHGSWSFLKTHLDTVIATFHDWGYATEVACTTLST